MDTAAWKRNFHIWLLCTRTHTLYCSGVFVGARCLCEKGVDRVRITNKRRSFFFFPFFFLTFYALHQGHRPFYFYYQTLLVCPTWTTAITISWRLGDLSLLKCPLFFSPVFWGFLFLGLICKRGKKGTDIVPHLLAVVISARSLSLVFFFLFYFTILVVLYSTPKKIFKCFFFICPIWI